MIKKINIWIAFYIPENVAVDTFNGLISLSG